jgi:DNA-binding protein HU-beta
VPLTQAQLVDEIADRAELSKVETKRALAALDEIVLDEIGNAQKVRIGGLVQLTPRVKPAQKKRKGRNPATGDEIEIAASTSAPGRWPKPKGRPLRCRRRAGDSPAEPPRRFPPDARR